MGGNQVDMEAERGVLGLGRNREVLNGLQGERVRDILLVP